MKLIIDIPEKVVTAIQNGEDYRYDIHTAIAQGTPYNPTGDLISRSEAKKLGATCLARRNENGQLEAIINLDNAPAVEYPFYAEAYQTGYEEAKKELESPIVEVLKIINKK